MDPSGGRRASAMLPGDESRGECKDTHVRRILTGGFIMEIVCAQSCGHAYEDVAAFVVH